MNLDTIAAALAEPAAFAAALSTTESHAIMVMARILPSVSGNTIIKTPALSATDSSGQGLRLSKGSLFLSLHCTKKSAHRLKNDAFSFQMQDLSCYHGDFDKLKSGKISRKSIWNPKGVSASRRRIHK